jgi:L-asparaginase
VRREPRLDRVGDASSAWSGPDEGICMSLRSSLLSVRRLPHPPLRAGIGLIVVLTLSIGILPPRPAIPAAASAPRRPTVVVIGTGGTMAGVSEGRFTVQHYEPGRLPTARLIKDLQPEIARLADVRAVDFDDDAEAITDLYDLSRQVDRELLHADAVVVTSGTNNLEEYAYWLDITVRSQKPVVVTGSLRPWTVVGSDAPMNLYTAVLLAASRRTTCFGTVVALNDQVLGAREATKSDSQRVGAFQSRELGVLGTVDDGRVRLLRAPARVMECDRPQQWRTPFDLSRIRRATLPRVEIVPTYLDAGGEAITAAARAGARGIVVSGAPSAAQQRAAEAVVPRGVIFVAAGNTSSGSVYPVPRPGLVSAGDLVPQKARLLLMLGLAEGGRSEQIAEWFAAYGVPQFNE